MFATVYRSPKVQKQLPDVNVHAASFEVEPLDVRGDFADEWAGLQNKWGGKTKKQVRKTPRLAAFRDFYSQIGFDPGQTPPSVENLIKRFLINSGPGHGYPNINFIVNAINVAAVEFEVPMGIFDTQAVDGEIRLDFTVGGEPFRPLGTSTPVQLDAGKLVLCDNEKVLSIFCYRDGETQKITPATRKVVLLGCEVPGIDKAVVFSAMERGICLLETVARLKPLVTAE